MKFNKMIFLSVLMPMTALAAALDTDTPKTIIAPKIEYNAKESSIKTTGKTEIYNTSGQRLVLNDSYFSKNGDNVSGNNIELVLGNHTYVSAEKVVRENQNTLAEHAVFTACYECDGDINAWEISTSRLYHDIENHEIEFRNPVFWAYDIPVAWFPYISMPDPTIKYKSGLLTPSFNSTNNMGTQFNLPIYVNLSDTHDFTFTPSYLTSENPLFQLEHRLNGPHSEFRTNASITHNKDGENRWHLFNSDTIEMGDHVRSKIFLERASDKTYLQKYGFYDDQPYLDSGARLEIFGQTGYAVAETHIFQELRTTRTQTTIPSGDILPNIRGVYQTDPFFNETYALFNTDILGIAGSGTASQRIIGESRIISPWTLYGGNRVTASISTRYDIYNFTNTEMMSGQTDYTGAKTRFLPSGYLEWSLPLSRIEGDWTHVIEPRARLTIMDHSSDTAFARNNDSAGALLSDAVLFADSRFSGLDLWENGTFADGGARWMAFDNSGKNVEVFVGQSYDFTSPGDIDPNSGFHRGMSDYVGRVSFGDTDWINVSSRYRFAEEDFDLRHIETSAFFGTTRNYISAGHIWAAQFLDAQTMDKNINEATAGFKFFLTDRFGMRFNAIYNITESRFQRHTGGLIYEHPCYFITLEYRRDNTIKEDYVGNTTFAFKFGINIGSGYEGRDKQ